MQMLAGRIKRVCKAQDCLKNTKKNNNNFTTILIDANGWGHTHTSAATAPHSPCSPFSVNRYLACTFAIARNFSFSFCFIRCTALRTLLSALPFATDDADAGKQLSTYCISHLRSPCPSTQCSLASFLYSLLLRSFQVRLNCRLRLEMPMHSSTPPPLPVPAFLYNSTYRRDDSCAIYVSVNQTSDECDV